MGLLAALGLRVPLAAPVVPAVEEALPSPPQAAAIGSPVATKSAGALSKLARWPDDAHRAWKKLTTADRIAVLEGMAKLYGKPFAQAFLQFTKGGTRLEQQHFVTALAHQTPQWFANKGYKLAQSSTYQQWWVHPDGHLIFLVLASTPEDLKKALDRILKSIAKADIDYREISTLGISLDFETPFDVPRPPDLLATFNDYVAKLSNLESFLKGELKWAAQARAALVKKGIGTTEFDEQAAELGVTLGSVEAMLKEENLDNLDPTKDHNTTPIDPKDMPPPIDYSGGKGP